jgi:hypothetical protein
MTQSPAQTLILVGRVAGGFGVRGEVRIATYTEDPLTLTKFKALTRQDGSPALTLTTARVAKDGVVARCVGIDTKEAADALRGLRLYVPRSALPEPDEDEFYLADLIGLTVRHVADQRPAGQDQERPELRRRRPARDHPGPGRPDLVPALHPRRRARGEDRRRPGPGRSAGDGGRAGRAGRGRRPI